jgi:acylphosphatase
MKARAHVYVSGDVQGVFFRVRTAETANRLGLSGWIRNLYDGRVEAIFEGEEDKVEEAIEFCRRGPPSAQVTNLDVKREEWTGQFQRFTIRY